MSASRTSLAMAFARGAVTPLAVLAAAVILTAWATPGLAGECGDDLAGVRVGCDCGDTVVADTRLRAGDPIVARKCTADGLLIRVPQGRRSIRVDLNGLELRGSGSGAGIYVQRGGEDGAVIVGGGEDGARGAISGFRDGVRAMVGGSLAAVAQLVISDCAHNGVVMRSLAARLEDVTIERNGSDGVRVRGRSIDLIDVESGDNRGRGLNLRVNGGVHSARSVANRKADKNSVVSRRDTIAEDDIP